MVLMNFFYLGDKIDYIDIGYWVEKVIKVVKSLGWDLKIIVVLGDGNYIYVF